MGSPARPPKVAVVFGVCAGYQLLGDVFPGSDGAPEPGVELLDVTTDRLPRRAVGELLAVPCAAGLQQPLTGYENHAGATHLGSGAAPLARVEAGVGNGSIFEGAVQGRMLGTYLHGPALARNPELADLLLTWVVGEAISPWVQADVDALRAERLGAVRGRALPADVQDEDASADREDGGAGEVLHSFVGFYSLPLEEVRMVSLSTLAPSRISVRSSARGWLPTWRTDAVHDRLRDLDRHGQRGAEPAR